MIKPLLDYICLGRDDDKIFVVHFVRAMQTLSPDKQTRRATASPDITDGMSKSRMSYDEAPGILERKLRKLPEQVQDAGKGEVGKVMVKIAQHLEDNDQLSTVTQLSVTLK